MVLNGGRNSMTSGQNEERLILKVVPFNFVKRRFLKSTYGLNENETETELQ